MLKMRMRTFRSRTRRPERRTSVEENMGVKRQAALCKIRLYDGQLSLSVTTYSLPPGVTLLVPPPSYPHRAMSHGE